MSSGTEERAASRSPGIPLALLLLLASGLSLEVGGQTVEAISDPFATGAVTTIDLDETALGAVNLVEVLKWQVPGLTVSEGPTGEINVAIRGGTLSLSGGGGSSSNPLLIIDGIPVSDESFTRELRTLNPFMVRRIQVLRDVASTSVYGTRGERGVILVYTRRR